VNAQGSYIVLALTIGIQILFGLALASRSLGRATGLFVAQAVLLVLTFVTYAHYVGNAWLLLWAAVAALLSVWFLPFFRGGLLYSARRMPPEDRTSLAGTAIYVVVAVLLVLLVGAHVPFRLVVEGRPLESLGSAVSVVLAGAALLFLYGVIAILTHRHAFKMVLGLMMMTEGAHLTLVHLAPTQLEVMKIGILTQVIPSIFMVLFVNRLVAAGKLAVTDTARLSELRG